MQSQPQSPICLRAPLLLAIIWISIGVGCGDDFDDDLTEVRSSTPRNTEPTVKPRQLREVYAPNRRAFALEMYHQLVAANPYDNMVYGPHSITTAMAMAYAGARGETADEIAQALSFEIAQDELHHTINHDDLNLNSGSQPTLHSANAIWAQRGATLEATFLDTLASHYDRGVFTADFTSAPNRARQHINSWVSERTFKRIPNLLEDNQLTPSTHWVLVNAVSFDHNWAEPFDPELSIEGSFTRLDGSQVPITAMRSLDTPRRYIQTDAVEGVWLDYAIPGKDNPPSLLILAPTEGTFTDFEASLDDAMLQTLQAQSHQDMVDLVLPTFNLQTRHSLSSPLQAMGLRTMFTAEANFSGAFADSSSHAITDLVHEAAIDVREQGTATAATSIVVGDGAAASQTVAITLDRPFIFLLVDDMRILLMGRFITPP
ncbi:MAG: serpin family protein [Myxococcota bacterium]